MTNMDILFVYTRKTFPSIFLNWVWSFACSSDDSYEGSLEYNSDISSHPQKLCLPANLNTPSLNGDVHTYDVPVESSPIRRYRSTDDIYASPVINIRNEDLPRSHHDTLYYASTDVITSNPNKVELGKSMTPVSLRRTFGFKKKLKIEKKCPQSVISSNSQNNKEDVSLFSVVFNSITYFPSGYEYFQSVTYLEQRVTRARLVRRRTLAQFDKQVAALCGSEPRLFEFVLLVELVEKSFSECGKPLLKPVTTFRFPEDKDEKGYTLYFTYVISKIKLKMLKEVSRPNYSFLIFLICDDYPMMIIGREMKNLSLPSRIMLLFEKTPIVLSFFQIEVKTVNGGVYPSVNCSLLFIAVIVLIFFKVAGSSLVILERYPNGTQRRLEIRNHGTVLGKTGCALVIERFLIPLSPEITVCIVAALLGEQRVLLAGNTVCSTTKTVQVMEALLRPLCWPHTFIPAVPDNLFDLCHNPTPYLMGILRLGSTNMAPSIYM
uniref:UDENN domain-containing protein n=1 Tax=Heterorhabditis bacteriophora TaxID=37862 RepID=A0A1I7WQ36_HETBA